MKHMVVDWFEIPVSDIRRARNFYQPVFNIEMFELNLAGDLRMALFPVEAGGIGGALCQHPVFYHPGKSGPLVYLNADPDLRVVLDRVQLNGGKVLIAKRQISPERGFMGVFEDSEGNRIALHSSG